MPVDRIPARLRALRPRPTGPAPMRTAISAVLATGLLAGAVAIGIGCGGGPSVDVTPSQAAPGSPSSLQIPDPPTGKSGFDPRSLAALPEGGGDAKAPQVPTLAVTLDGSLGLSTSLTPTLAWPDGPSSGVDWKVTDLSGKAVITESGRENTLQVPKGALKGGNAYLWSASADGRTFGPHLMRVDLQRADVQGAVDYAGVGVTAVTGEPVIALATPAVTAVSGPVSVGLSYQPTNRQSAVSSPGVPPGWAISSTSAAPWAVLRRPANDRIELTDSSGQVVPFRQSSPGAWMADWGAGQGWPSGQYAVLAQAQGLKGAPFQITDRSGQVTTFPDTAVGTRSYPASTWSAKNPVPQSTYDASGRLTKVTDPVSGRSITLAYGGSGACPSAAASGFTGAPDGMLCEVTGWDGSVTQVFYARRAGAAVIARVVTDVEAGGQKLAQTDIGYDAAGRPDRIRAPLANAALAAGVLPDGIRAEAPDVMTSIGYDARGRVATITRPAAVVSGAQGTVPGRSVRAFAYPENGRFTVSQPGRDAPISTATASPSTMLTTQTTDSAGRVTATEWNPSSQAPTQITAPGGMVTRYSYDALGRPLATTGPTTDPDAPGAPRTSYRYDTEPGSTAPGSAAKGAPTPIEGLLATYWQGGEFQGTPGGASIGPRISARPPSRLDIRWPQSPLGQGAFTARLEGLVVVPEGGIQQIRNTVPSSQVWVNGIRCPGTEPCPDSLSLAGKKSGDLLQIRIDVRSNGSGVATAGAAWTTSKGTGAIPASALRPGLPQATATTVRDQLTPGGAITELTTQSRFSPSDPQQMIAARSPSGLEATRGYEAYTPGSGGFGRATEYTSPARDITTTRYYGRSVGAATGCEGAADNQGGLVQSKTTPGGLSITQAYDAAGNVVGQQATGRAAKCNTYDATGMLVRAQTGSVVVSRDRAVANNPLHARVTSAQDGTTRTASTVTDLLGRTVRTTDVWGTTVTTAYDSEDRPVEVRTVTKKGQATTTTYAYTADGQVQKVARDGTTLAEVGYQESTGRLQGAEYANGSSTTLTYDANGNVTRRTLSVGGREITEEASLAPSGRTMSRQVTGAGADATWSYSYDRDGRLTKADLSGSAPYGVKTGAWAYQLNNASERTKLTSPYTPADGFTYSYAPSGAMTATSDTRFGNRFEYDSAGRAVRAGPLSLAYDVTGALERISDGSTTESRVISGGEVIASAITTPEGQKAIRYSASGLLLDATGPGAGLVDSQMMGLPGGVRVQLPPPPAPNDAGGPAQADPGTTETAPAPASKDEPPSPLPMWRYSDLQGSVAWTSTGEGEPTDTVLFDPDGNRLGDPPALSSDPSRPNLLFEGTATAPLSIPVSQMGARSYVPALGIFLQPDPVPNGSSTAYDFAGGDPINSSDTTGRWTEWVGIGVAFVASVAIGIAIGAATAGLGGGPAAAVAFGLLGGAVAGAAGEVIGQLGSQLVDYWVTGNVPPGINWDAFWGAAIGGAVFGGVSSLVTAARGASSIARATSVNKLKLAQKPVNKVGSLGPKGRSQVPNGFKKADFADEMAITQEEVSFNIKMASQGLDDSGGSIGGSLGTPPKGLPKWGIYEIKEESLNASQILD